MYDPENLSVLAYANGFTLWHYRTETDDLDVVASAGYFGVEHHGELRINDMIIINARNGNGQIFVQNSNVMSDADLLEIMRTPLYWRDHDPALVEYVREEFRRRYQP